MSVKKIKIIIIIIIVRVLSNKMIADDYLPMYDYAYLATPKHS